MPEHGPVCWWQFLCDYCFSLPAMCTCATLLSCTSGKSICPPWQSEGTDRRRGSSQSASLCWLCYSCRPWKISRYYGYFPIIQRIGLFTYSGLCRYISYMRTAECCLSSLVRLWFILHWPEPLVSENLLHCSDWFSIKEQKCTSQVTRSLHKKRNRCSLPVPLYFFQLHF